MLPVRKKLCTRLPTLRLSSRLLSQVNYGNEKLTHTSKIDVTNIFNEYDYIRYAFNNQCNNCQFAVVFTSLNNAQ